MHTQSLYAARIRVTGSKSVVSVEVTAHIYRVTPKTFVAEYDAVMGLARVPWNKLPTFGGPLSNIALASSPNEALEALLKKIQREHEAAKREVEHTAECIAVLKEKLKP